MLRQSMRCRKVSSQTGSCSDSSRQRGQMRWLDPIIRMSLAKTTPIIYWVYPMSQLTHVMTNSKKAAEAVSHAAVPPSRGCDSFSCGFWSCSPGLLASSEEYVDRGFSDATPVASEIVDLGRFANGYRSSSRGTDSLIIGKETLC